MEAFTAGAIVHLATQKFLESSAGELAKTFTSVVGWVEVTKPNKPSILCHSTTGGMWVITLSYL